MKAIILFAAIVLEMLITSCKNTSDEKSVAELFKDPKTEEEIYSAILSNNERTKKLIDRMMVDENTRSMLAGNSSMMKMMCLSGSMDSLVYTDAQMSEEMINRLLKAMAADSVVCDKTCTRMMKDESIRKRIMEHANKGK